MSGEQPAPSADGKAAVQSADLALVRRVVAEEVAKLGLDVPAEYVRETSRLLDDLGLKHLDKLELAFALEDRLPGGDVLDLRKWQTVGDVVGNANALVAAWRSLAGYAAEWMP